MPSSQLAVCLFSAVLLVQAEVTDFRFGDYAVDQCSNPVKTVTNTGGASGVRNTLMQRDSSGVCRSVRGYCVGDCVTVVVTSTGGLQSRGINVIVGGNLPDTAGCGNNFESSGSCGGGKQGNGFWHNCLIHDVCGWARCDDPGAIVGGIIPGAGGTDDEFCGKSFDDGVVDYLHAHGLPSCTADDKCPSGTDCILGLCRQQDLPEGSLCAVDADCKGYCHLLQCYDGSNGDSCNSNSDCQLGLTCYGEVGLGKCRAPKPEGSLCADDSDCKGYCHLLTCFDGSEGDRCGSDSDCQSGLTCYGVAGAGKCRNLKNEGSLCASDSDCKGYCQSLYCWDGSKDDQCGSTSDCQSGLSCSRCWFCPFKRCN
ncbi:hypothetical protein DIPPA_12701 [Diplonema papillatum]|nr:hypothetical protein DIPPA_12701 [Diplonema papillatum]